MSSSATAETLTVVAFSKDRPLQLHAALSSLRATCTDPERLRVRALVCASTDAMARRYLALGRELPWAELVAEQGFRETLLRTCPRQGGLAFVVDDALFVRSWSAGAALDALRAIPGALGVSLRLGRNTVRCYTLGDRPQAVPPVLEAGPWLAYAWPGAELDFGYPLELSSSVYRAEDVAPLLETLAYRNPNQLEAALAGVAGRFADARPLLLMPESSVAFCAPVNVVQDEFPNRAGGRPELAPEPLGELFDRGHRIDVEALTGHVPPACHEEIELPLRGGAAPGSSAAAARGDARPTLPAAPADPASTVAALRDAGVWADGTPLRLHLGCGERRLDGYVNLDLPPARSSLMATRADAFADVAELRFPAGSVDEIRSHHVFEHFPRVEALALLVRWHEWLRPGGRLVIETPDLEGSARTLLSDQPLGVKMGVVRHLAGDQAEGWAFHVDHWFGERFAHTLAELGFDDVRIERRSWERPPFLSDVTAAATKARSLARGELLTRADALLAQSIVAPEEHATLRRWQEQLRARLDGGPSLPPAAAPPAAPPPAPPRPPRATTARPAPGSQHAGRRSRSRMSWTSTSARATAGSPRARRRCRRGPGSWTWARGPAPTARSSPTAST